MIYTQTQNKSALYVVPSTVISWRWICKLSMWGHLQQQCVELKSWELNVLLNFPTFISMFSGFKLITFWLLFQSLQRYLKQWNPFLGFKNAYHRFIYSSSSVAAAFMPFLMDKPEFRQWDAAALKIFQSLSDSLSSKAVPSQHHGLHSNLHLLYLSLFTPITSLMIKTLMSMLGSDADALSLRWNSGSDSDGSGLMEQF